MKVYNHTFDDSRIEQGRSAKKRKETVNNIVLLGKLILGFIALYTVIKLM